MERSWLILCVLSMVEKKKCKEFCWFERKHCRKTCTGDTNDILKVPIILSSSLFGFCMVLYKMWVFCCFVLLQCNKKILKYLKLQLFSERSVAFSDRFARVLIFLAMTVNIGIYGVFPQKMRTTILQNTHQHQRLHVSCLKYCTAGFCRETSIWTVQDYESS